MALPIWALYMKRCYADPTLNVSKEPFEEPEFLSIEIDCEKYNAGLRGKRGPDDENDTEIDF